MWVTTVFFFKQKTAYEMRISDWSSDVCSSDLWIMAVMLLRTVLAAALGLGMRGAAQSLDRQLAGRLTVQIVEADARVREAHAAQALARLRAMGDEIGRAHV